MRNEGVKVDKNNKKIVVCVSLDQDLEDKIVKGIEENSWIKEYSLHFVHIFKVQEYPYLIPSAVYPTEDQKSEIKRTVNLILEGIAKKVSVDHAHFYTLFDAHPKSAIIDFVKHIDPQFVLTVTRGKHGIEGLFSSSFTDHLIEYSPSHVLALR